MDAKKVPGSVHVLDGIVYSSNWEIVFIPLNPVDLQKYLDSVAAAQARAGRCLTFNELARLQQLLGV